MRVGWYSAEIGNGMADMLNDALVQSNRFIVLDRQSLQDVLMEQDLGATGRIRPNTAAKIGEIEGAELLIKGSVTEFEPGAGGAAGSTALGFFGLPGALVGGALAGVEQSHIAMVVQVVDARTSRILFSSTVEGKANDFNLSGVLGGFGRNFSMSSGLGVWQKTPMEKAIRVAIMKAVQEVANKTPKTYYRHGALQAAAGTPALGISPAVAVLPSSPAPSPVKIAATAAVIKVKSANLREAPGTHGRVLATLKEGTKLAINGEEKDWLFVQTEDGKLSGWVGKTLVK
jgi:curli biogenesis system outer membrane secretion channel CsgG